MSRLLAVTVWLLAGSLLAGCASTGSRTVYDEYRWPIDQPRVGLERIVSSATDLGTGGLVSLWRRITGVREARLFERPYGVAWHGDGLVVTDPGAGAVLRLDLDARATVSSPMVFQSPIGVAVCGEDVAVSDSETGEVVLLDDRLRFDRQIATGLSRPTGLTCADRSLWVLETGRHRLLRFDLSSSEENRWVESVGVRGEAAGEFNFPTAVTSSHDSLWVADTLNFRLQELRHGAVRAQFGRLGDAPGDLPRTKGVALDALGRLWVSDAHLDQVALFETDGSWLLSLGRSGGGVAEFSFPAGIATHEDGRVAVVDSLNRRVQIFRLLAEGASGAG